MKREWLKASLAAGALVVGMIVVVFMRRESAAERHVRETIAALRSAGEPVTFAGLKARFPSPQPEENAAVLFGAMLNIATNQRLIGNIPYISADAPPLNEPLPESIRAALAKFCESTRELRDVLPTNVPLTARFECDWANGFTNNAGVRVLHVRMAWQLIVAHALNAIERGNTEDALRILESGFAFAHSIPVEGSLVQHMIRHSGETLMCSVTERAVNRLSFTDVQLQRLESAIREEPPDAFKDSARYERVMNIWACELLRNGAPAAAIFPQPRVAWWKGLWERIKDREPTYRDEDFALLLRFSPARLDWSHMPPRELIRQLEADSAECNAKARSKIGRVFRPYFGRAAAGHFEANARVRVTKTSLAVQRAWLTDAAAVKTFALPNDLFTNAPLRLKELPRGFMVYSIGRDFTDNGGRLATNMLSTNYDLTFSVER